VTRAITGHASQLTLLLREPPATADALLERLRELGLRDFTQCRLTRNRNVMVSFRAAELRVHEGYLGAPDDVLAAIVTFVQARRRADRARARRTLLAHPIETGIARRRDTMHPDDHDAAQRFRDWHARYNAQFFGGVLRDIPVRVSRRMRARLGHYSCATKAGDPPEIAISRRHLRRHGWDEALETLLHEMVHQWQDENGLPLDHGSTFRRKAREIGISPFACRKVA
jgi:hypothetical protein